MTKYKLSNRTYEKLNELNDKIELANILNKFLAASPFIEIFTSKPGISTIWQLSTTDWQLFANTVNNIKEWENSVLRKFCLDEEAYHARHNNRDDKLFWKKMKESFDG